MAACQRKGPFSLICTKSAVCCQACMPGRKSAFSYLIHHEVESFKKAHKGALKAGCSLSWRSVAFSPLFALKARDCHVITETPQLSLPYFLFTNNVRLLNKGKLKTGILLLASDQHLLLKNHLPGLLPWVSWAHMGCSLFCAPLRTLKNIPV